MNPWAVILLLLAVGAIIIGTKGTQDNLYSAVVGHRVGNPNISGTQTQGGGLSIFGLHIPFTDLQVNGTNNPVLAT